MHDRFTDSTKPKNRTEMKESRMSEVFVPARLITYSGLLSGAQRFIDLIATAP